MLANQHGAYTPKQRGQAAAELCILATTTGVKRMSDQTKGDVKDRLRQWIELCEQSQTTGEATDIMQAAIDRMAYLETEHGDPMIKWMSAESLEMHVVRLKQQLSERAMVVSTQNTRIAELEQQVEALQAERDKAVNALKTISFNLKRVDEEYDDFSFYCDTRALIKEYLAAPEPPKDTP